MSFLNEDGNAVQSVSAVLAVGQSGGRSATKGENGVDSTPAKRYNENKINQEA